MNEMIEATVQWRETMGQLTQKFIVLQWSSHSVSNSKLQTFSMSHTCDGHKCPKCICLSWDHQIQDVFHVSEQPHYDIKWINYLVAPTLIKFGDRWRYYGWPLHCRVWCCCGLAKTTLCLSWSTTLLDLEPRVLLHPFKSELVPLRERSWSDHLW